MQMSKNMDASQNYQRLSIIGAGNFGEVHLVKDTQGRVHAMKTLENINNAVVLEQIRKEVEAMQKVDSFYALEINTSFYDEFEAQYCILTPYYQLGDLKKHLDNKTIKWNDIEIISFLAQVTAAFVRLKQKNILHRDLKPANILVAAEGVYKVADFGCSKFLQNNESRLVRSSRPFGTQLYNSPEVSLEMERGYNSSTDVWSLGVILYEILYHRYPIQKSQRDPVYVYQNLVEVAEGKRKIEFPEHPGINPRIKELLQKMLIVDSDKRWRWGQVQKFLHENFENLIHDMNLLLEHSMAQARILCILIELLNRHDNTQLLTQAGMEHRSWSTLKNCLIILQYQQLADLEKILLENRRVEGVIIMPHIYHEFAKERPKQFYLSLQKNKAFRDFLTEKFEIQKLRNKVEALCRTLHAILLKIDRPHDLPLMLHIAEMLGDYRTSFRFRNNSDVVVKYDQFQAMAFR